MGGDGPGSSIRPQIVSPQKTASEWRRGSHIISQVNTPQDYPRPAINMLINNKTVTALLDTQASGSFISSRLTNLLPEIQYNDMEDVRGAVKYMKYKCLGQGILKGKCSTVNIDLKVMVILNLDPDIILGHDFLTQYGVILDYTSQELFIGKESRVRIAWLNGNVHSTTCLSDVDIKSELQVGPLKPNQEGKLNNLFMRFPEVITDKIGFTTTVKHVITCSNYSPIKQRPYPMSPDKRNFVINKVQEMESQGLIEPSSSSWASPIVLPKKKNGEYRLCVDYRKLNERTVSDAYPMPDLKSLLKKVSGAKVYSTLDLNSGYWQVEVDEASRALTAFMTPKGLYQFKVMAFGLKNAPATFMRLMDEVLSGYTGVFCQVYLDDILVYSNDFESHLLHLAKVFERLKIHGLTCQLKKCHFVSPRVEYLGHVLTPEGLERVEEKNVAIEKMERPRTKRQIRQFLGTCGWYSSFVPHFEVIAAPLTDMLNKNKPFKWSQKEEDAFQLVKKTVCQAPRLSHPDPHRVLCLQTDASDIGLGAVLFQEGTEGRREVIEYASRKLSPTEKKYCTAEKEALGVVWAVGKFRGYLEGKKFKLFTDNSSLQWLNKLSNTKSKLMRWAMLLAGFDYEIHHVPGSENQAPDALSRNPTSEPGLDRELPEREFPDCANVVERFPVLMALVKDIDTSTIKRWQAEDSACTEMMVWLNSCCTTSEGVPKEFKMCYKNFRLEQGVLMYSSHISNLASVIVIPKSRANEILGKFHDDKEAGHPGREETYNSIRQRFFWVSMRRDIAKYVRTCSICASTKASNHKADSTMRGRRPHQPWEVIALDIMGPYPRTSKGKTNILVVTDLFTRWIEAFAIPEATTNRIVSLLHSEVFSRYGYPRCILSDNGSQFTSRQWKNAIAQWGVEHWTTPVYGPRANPTERRNQELKRVLRVHLCDNEHKRWDQYLPDSLLALRQRVNRVTGYSPAELFLGRRIHRIGDWKLPNVPEVNHPTLDEWQRAAKTECENRQAEATERTQRQAEGADVDAAEDLVPGQLVMRRNHPQSSKIDGYHAGLAPKWVGPFEVEQQLGPGVYTLKTSPATKVHISELKVLSQPLRPSQREVANREDDNAARESPRYNLRPRR